VKRVVISLGGGCDVSLQLQKYNLRKVSLPFDWLWNLDGGLGVVDELLSSRFSQARRRCDFEYADHYKWPGEKTLVFKKYPKVAFIHSNPLESKSDFESFNRRIDRFFEILDAPDVAVIFVYYRQNNEAGCLGEDALSNMDLLSLESETFMKNMRYLYPEKSMRLISLFEAEKEIIFTDSARTKLDRLNDCWKSESIAFDFILPRSDLDQELRKEWHNKWYDVLKSNGLIHGFSRYLAIPARVIRKTKKLFERRV